MSKIKVSVIVPIYRVENYLPQCIESLIKQSFKDFELILVNDGSPDSSPQICDSYAKKDSRIKVVHKENGGLLSARKAGLKVASGEYIAWVDGDDWVDPHFLSILYKLAITNNADLTVTGHFREFDGKIETIKPHNPGIYNEGQIRSSIITKAIFNGEFCEHGMSTYVWNKLFKREILNDVLYNVHNDIIMGEDAAITYTYLAHTKRLVISKIPLYYYRQRHDSIVKSIENPAMEYYRLGLVMNHLYKNLTIAIDKVALKRQIDFYLYSQLIVRTGGVIKLNNNSSVFNPFKNITKGSKIAVYSSGSFGQHVISTNLKTKYFNIVNWVDIDYHELKIGDTTVEPISAINNEDIDNFIIATINSSTHRMIEKELELFGISNDKIEKIETDELKINQLFKDLGFDENYLFKADTHLS